MNRILVRAALGIFILFVLTSSAFPQWIQTNWSDGDSFFELYSNEGVVFARVWDVANGGRVFFTDDNGDNWAAISSPDNDIDILSIAMWDNQILAGAWDGLYRTMLSDISWEEFTPAGIPADSPVWSITKINDNLFASGTGAIYKASITDVNTWTEIKTGIPDKSYFNAIIKYGNVLFAGSDNAGVFISKDDGASWTSINTGLGDLHIYHLEVVDSELFAVTFKEGVFKLNIDGIDAVSDYSTISWVADKSNIGNVICFLDTEEYLFAGTDTNGVCISEDSGQSWITISKISESIRAWSMIQSNGSIFAATTDGILRINPQGIKHTITASSNEGGTISPEGELVVYESHSSAFTITPELGYKINDVLVDGNSVGVVYSYEMSDVNDDHTISVEFLAVPIYTITASSEEGGSISPSGTVQLSETWSKEFTITTSPGHAIDYVMVDGNSVGAVSSYTFTNVSSDHTISVKTKEAPYIITASANEGGSISPSGDVEVWGGESQKFTITSSEGYIISDVIIDGVSVGAVTSYTFSSVDNHHTISASFASLVAYQINCGGSNESPFTADAYYQGGSTSTGWGTVITTDVNDPAPSAVYLIQRRGNFKYTLQNLVGGASYIVRLHFSDNTYSGRGGSTGSSSRFNVIVNGATVLSDYHIYTAAGGTYKAVIEKLIAAADTSGQIVIEFVPTQSSYNATVAGIEIIMQ